MQHALILVALLAATPALAAPCGAGGDGATTLHYATGETGLTPQDKARLADFAAIAASKSHVCIFAQVDDQGSDAVNAVIAEGRAQRVKAFLVDRGVPADRIAIAKQEAGFTLFGLLSSDQAADRAVTVSYE